MELDGWVQVYTDGACLDNGTEAARAGVGVWWGPGHRTNNVAEIQAICLAITQAVHTNIRKLQINTDSRL